MQGLAKAVSEMIAILDFGSQYTHLIARRIRENNVYCEIFPFNVPLNVLKKKNLKGMIFSGGPASVYLESSPLVDKKIFDLGIPVLGICYGMQLAAFLLNGKVCSSGQREYGLAELLLKKKSILFKSLPSKFQVWMSHGDLVTKMPEGFENVAYTVNSPVAVMQNEKKKLYAIQFHPEVVHTIGGKQILKNFAYEICKCKGAWTMKSFVGKSIDKIVKTVKKDKVLCGLSGGVDSSVTAALLHKAIGDNLTCMFINNGLLRENEAESVMDTFKNKMKLNLIYVDASNAFLRKLANVTDPEKKRKIIGHTFIEVFEKESRKLGKIKYLAQGTLYPDVIESTSVKGPSATIKTHHNVGGLPVKVRFKLIEPLRELFKDEVRILGKELGLSGEIVGRHPFPGPGLAVRILGSITSERLEVLRKADFIMIEEIRKANLYNEIWQAFAVLLPVKTVGVMGDERTYENVIAIRAVTSQDGMTADWAKIPYEVLTKISNRIINEVKGVNRVVYDVSSKPPSTIEWE